MIPFNVPPFLGTEPDLIMQAVKNQKICGDGPFTKQCHQWLEEKTGSPKALLTTSCTHALEMAALLLHPPPTRLCCAAPSWCLSISDPTP